MGRVHLKLTSTDVFDELTDLLSRFKSWNVYRQIIPLISLQRKAKIGLPPWAPRQPLLKKGLLGKRPLVEF